MWTTKAQINLRIHAVWSAPLLFAAWIVTRFYSSKLYSSIGTYTVSPNCQFAESVLSLHVHLLKSEFHPAGSMLHRFCFPVHRCGCRFFVINLLTILWLLGDRFLNCEWTLITEVKIHRDKFKNDISFWIYVKIRHENFSFNISIVQLLLTIWKRTAFCLKNYGNFKGLFMCCVCYVPSDLRRTEKYGFEWYITQRSMSVWVLSSRHTEYEWDVSVQAGDTFRQALLKYIHLPPLARIFTIGC